MQFSNLELAELMFIHSGFITLSLLDEVMKYYNHNHNLRLQSLRALIDINHYKTPIPIQVKQFEIYLQV